MAWAFLALLLSRWNSESKADNGKVELLLNAAPCSAVSYHDKKIKYIVSKRFGYVELWTFMHQSIETPAEPRDIAGVSRGQSRDLTHV